MTITKTLATRIAAVSYDDPAGRGTALGEGSDHGHGQLRSGRGA